MKITAKHEEIVLTVGTPPCKILLDVIFCKSYPEFGVNLAGWRVGAKDSGSS